MKRTALLLSLACVFLGCQSTGIPLEDLKGQQWVWPYFARGQLTLDRFVDELAARSMTYDTPYQARLPDGTIVDLSVWLRERADEISHDQGEARSGAASTERDAITPVME